MGNRSKKGDFKPGNKFSKGRPKLPPELKAIQLLSKDEFKKTISKYISMDLLELEKYHAQIKLKSLRVLDGIIIALIIKAFRDQDIQTIDWLATRSVGKVKDEVDHNITNTVHSEILNYIKNRNQDELPAIGEEKKDDST